MILSNIPHITTDHWAAVVAVISIDYDVIADAIVEGVSILVMETKSSRNVPFKIIIQG